MLHAERFVDQAPASVWATLLDEGSYLASVSTMYRLLRARGETGDRRRHATHPPTVKPELLADQAQPVLVVGHHQAGRAGQVDLLLPISYVNLDIYSRYLVGWMVAHREAALLAERLLADTIARTSATTTRIPRASSRPSSCDDPGGGRGQGLTLPQAGLVPLW